jgi:hypothetical protein
MQRITALWHDSPLNIVTAGNLTHSNSKAPGAILTVAGLKPGQSDSGTVDLANTGDSAGVFTLSKSGLTNSDGTNPLATKLDLVVEDLGDPSAPTAPVVKYTGKLGAMGAVALGTWAFNAAHRYRFTVTFPDGGVPAGPNSGDNAYKGDNVSVTYNWESVSN